MRPPRIHYEGAVFHVMSRGNGGQDIFLGNEDYAQFLRLLLRTKGRLSFYIYAYCLMPNHFHLLLRVGRVKLSSIMHALLTWYANAFNISHNRTGHLFQNRYKSIDCSADPYLVTLIRYIHMNPVRAGLVKTTEDWRWTSYGEYVGERSPTVADPAFPLSMLHASPEIARTMFCELLGELGGQPPTSVNHESLTTATPDTLLGSADSEELDAPSLDELAARVCSGYDLEVGDIRGPDQTHAVSAVRKILIRAALEQGTRPSEIARFLGRSPALITKYAKTEKSEKEKG